MQEMLNYGVTPLYHAAMHNYEDMADLLLEKGADVNARDKNGYSLLYDGIRDHSINAVKLLISKGTNVNIENDAGYTPLVYVIWENDEKHSRTADWRRCRYEPGAA